MGVFLGMYILKHLPEDFIVKEVADRTSGEGNCFIYRLWKKDLATLQAIKKIALLAHVDQKQIGYAGNKDKKAITEQFISLPRKISNVALEHLKLTFVGQGQRINLGDLFGNQFQIILRNMEEKKELHPEQLRNYFGEQRFSKTNATVGKAIIKGDFKTAAALVDHNEVRSYLEQHPEDPVGALRCLQKRLLKLLINAYQSELWNKVVEELTPPFPSTVPLISFDTDFQNEKIEQMYEKILQEEGIQLRDFILPKMKDLTPQTQERNVLLEVKDFNTKYEEDDLFPGKLKCALTFSLGKGSYATEVVRQMFDQ